MPNVPMTGRQQGERDADVTASELASFVYCAKAWHLERVLGAMPSTRANERRDVGIGDHARHGNAVRAGSWLARNSAAVVAGFVLLAILFALLAIILG